MSGFGIELRLAPQTLRASLQELTRRVRELGLPIGPLVVPFDGLSLESYKVIPERNYLGAYG